MSTQRLPRDSQLTLFSYFTTTVVGAGTASGTAVDVTGTSAFIPTNSPVYKLRIPDIDVLYTIDAIVNSGAETYEFTFQQADDSAFTINVETLGRRTVPTGIGQNNNENFRVAAITRRFVRGQIIQTGAASTITFGMSFTGC